MIKTINAWRGIFAVIIVLYHSHVIWAVPPTRLGVSFFFVASGLLLTLRHRHEFDSVSPRAWWQFLWCRARRLYPLHWLAMAMVIVLHTQLEGRTFDVLKLLPELTLTHAWWFDNTIYYSSNGPSWFLSALLFCYACFPLVDRWWSQWRIRWQMLTLLVVIIAVSCIVPALSEYWLDYMYVCPLMRFVDFVLGVTAGNLLRAMFQQPAMPQRYSTSRATLCEASVLAIIALVWLLAELTHPAGEQFLVWWIPATLLVLVSALLNGHEGWVGRPLLWRPLQWLGKVSTEVYLFQLPIGIVVTHTISPLLGHFGVPGAYDHYVYFQVPLLLLFAGGMHWLRTTLRRGTHSADVTSGDGGGSNPAI